MTPTEQLLIAFTLTAWCAYLGWGFAPRSSK